MTKSTIDADTILKRATPVAHQESHGGTHAGIELLESFQGPADIKASQLATSGVAHLGDRAVEAFDQQFHGIGNRPGP